MSRLIDETLLANVEQEEEFPLISRLVELGRRKGFVTTEDILTFFPEVEEDIDLLDKALASLLSAGISYVDDGEEPAEVEEETSPEAKQGKKLTRMEERELEDPLAEIEASDLVGLYLKEAASVPLLTAEEESELARRIERGRKAREELSRSDVDSRRRGDLYNLIQEEQEAMEHLITANSRLVVSIAKKYAGQGLSLSDLIQEGNIGLMRAAKKFDYTRGYKFSTYATWWIRQAVGRAVATYGRTIRIPVHMKDRIRKLMRVQYQLKQHLQRDPTIEELAEALDLPPKKIEQMLEFARHPLSLEMPINSEDDTVLGDFVEDSDSPNPEETVTQNLLREQLLETLDNTLPPREARILKMRYGLLDGETHTLREVGSRTGVTRERVRQIEAQALRRLRHPSVRTKLIEFLGG